MSLLSALAVAAFAVNLFVGVLVFLHDRRRVLNQVFVLAAGCFSAWALSTFVLAQRLSPTDALWWTRLLISCAALAPALLLHLVSLLFDDCAKRVLPPVYAVAGVLLLFTWVGMLDEGVRTLATGADGYRWYGSAGALTWLLPLYGVAVGLYGVRLLVEAASRAHGIRRAQGYYFLVGAVPVVAAGVHDFLGASFGVYPLLGLSFAPMVPLASAFWSALLGFTILRYRLIDLDYAIARGMVRTLTLAVLVIPFFLLLLAAEQSYHGTVYLDFSMLTLAICTLAAFIVPPLSHAAERKIGNAIFGRSRGYRDALVAFSEESTRILDLETLIERVMETLTSALGVSSAAVYVARDQNARGAQAGWELGGQRGTTSGHLPPALQEAHPLVARLMASPEPVVREELEIEVEARRGPRATVEAMSEMGVALALPLKGPESLEGIITLGAREDGAVFTQEDLGVLTILTNQLATAMGNARLYADLKRSRELIERSERLSSIGTMAAGLAHEIRNPLVSIRTFTQLLPERINDKEFREQFLDLTLSEVDRICALINELLAFARPAPAEHTAMDVDECLERICMLLNGQARGRSVGLEFSESTADVTITADEDQVKQVVMNVILNAIQACSNGGVVNVVAYPTVCEKEHFVCVEISDDGAGMGEDLIEHIFDPFFTTRRDGTGLGLSIAHQIVTRHGGRIDVRSCAGEGTTFYVHLPLVPPAGQRDEPAFEAEDLRLHG